MIVVKCIKNYKIYFIIWVEIFIIILVLFDCFLVKWIGLLDVIVLKRYCIGLFNFVDKFFFVVIMLLLEERENGVFVGFFDAFLMEYVIRLLVFRFKLVVWMRIKLCRFIFKL